ncbi:hypothetical protein HZC08_02625 [Candidatus Micrarchaeota archaeon]|nr:hypothetical protein [Candidatus Micrarchaeota archaeon]
MIRNSGMVESVRVQQVCLVAGKGSVKTSRVVAAIGKTPNGRFDFNGESLRFESAESDLICVYEPGNGKLKIRGDLGETVNGVPKRFLDALGEAWIYCCPRGLYAGLDQRLRADLDGLEIANEGPLSN